MKLKGSTKTFIEEGHITSYFCIEILMKRHWSLLGTGDGPYRFRDKSERDKKLRELKHKIGQ